LIEILKIILIFLLFSIDNLDDLNGHGVGLNDILGYHDFLSQFKTFFLEDMQTFKKSLKDIIELYKSAEKQELK